MRLRNIPTSPDARVEEKVVVQLQTICWEDDNAMSTSNYEDLDKILRYIKKHRMPKDEPMPITSTKPPSPIIVHCSAGIGRTGTLTAIYAIIEGIEWLHRHGKIITKDSLISGVTQTELNQLNETYPDLHLPRISVFGTVRKMREQRWSMVKKQVQYAFVYDYVERWVQKHRIDFE